MGEEGVIGPRDNVFPGPLWLSTGLWRHEEIKVSEFLPRDAMQSAVLPWQVVCPSVTLTEASFFISDVRTIEVRAR